MGKSGYQGEAEETSTSLWICAAERMARLKGAILLPGRGGKQVMAVSRKGISEVVSGVAIGGRRTTGGDSVTHRRQQKS